MRMTAKGCTEERRRFVRDVEILERAVEDAVGAENGFQA